MKTALLLAVAAVIAAVGALVASCGTHPGIPATVAEAPAATHHPSRPAYDPVLGVDLYAQDNYTPAQVRVYGTRMLAYIKNTLHADAVGIVWDFFAPGDTSNVVESTPATLTPAGVAILTRIAHRDGLAVYYRPLMFALSYNRTPWEGAFQPPDQAAWFTSYYQAEKPYLKVAQRLRVAGFVAGTELHDLNSSTQWPGFLTRIARIYHGAVSYAEWDGDYFKHRWVPVTPIGMDMYPHLRLRPGATVAQVEAAWIHELDRVPATVQQRTLIDETGIEARTGAYRNPPALNLPGRLDEQVQANWFLAGCRAVQARHLRGLFIWKTDLADNPAHPSAALSVFEGRKGAAAIRECASILH